MRFNYDPQTDSLYIHFAEGAGVDSIIINDDVVADVNEQGALIGLDIQHASKTADLNQLTLSGMAAGVSALRP